MKKSDSCKQQVVYLALAAFFGLIAYPLTRTSAAPYFNAAYGSDYLSWAMISSAVLAVLAVVIYNNLAKRFRLLPLCIGLMFGIVLITLFFGFIMGHHPRWLALIYYSWSDVYILILVEQFWSISNTLFDKAHAKRYYGLLLTCGSSGSFVGNALVVRLAGNWGSASMILLCSLFLLTFILFIFLLKNSIEKRSDLKPKFEIEHEIADHSVAGGASLVFKNRYILLIALLVLSVQLFINTTYFFFNNHISSMTDIIDKQSVLYGKTYLVIQIVTVVLSFIVTPLVLKLIGVAKTHYSILAILAAIFCAALLSPQLLIIALLFVVAKSFDYSIFRAAKELFYLPLLVAEKFQAKAFIDVFVYRLSKALAALGIILIHQVLHLNLLYLIGFGLCMWFVVIYFILKKYREIDRSIRQG